MTGAIFEFIVGGLNGIAMILLIIYVYYFIAGMILEGILVAILILCGVYALKLRRLATD